jgi:hypothetical protein
LLFYELFNLFSVLHIFFLFQSEVKKTKSKTRENNIKCKPKKGKKKREMMRKNGARKQIKMSKKIKSEKNK